jgi:hypothetical protein
VKDEKPVFVLCAMGSHYVSKSSYPKSEKINYRKWQFLLPPLGIAHFLHY